MKSYICFLIALFALTSAAQIREGANETPREINASGLRLVIPAGASEKKVKCIDSTCLDFVWSTFELGIEVSPYAAKPTYQRRFKSYSDEATWLDDTQTIAIWKWSFIDRSGDYSAGALISSVDCNTKRISITFSSSDSKEKEIWEEMVKSIKIDKFVCAKQSK